MYIAQTSESGGYDTCRFDLVQKTTQTVWSVADSSWVETSVAGEAAAALAVVALTFKRKVAKSSIIS